MTHFWNKHHILPAYVSLLVWRHRKMFVFVKKYMLPSATGSTPTDYMTCAEFMMHGFWSQANMQPPLLFLSSWAH